MGPCQPSRETPRCCSSKFQKNPSKRRTSNGSTLHSISVCNSKVKSAKATSIVQLCLRYPRWHNYGKSLCFHVVNQISMGHVQCQTVSLPEGKNRPGGDPNTLWTSLTGAITYQQGYIAISQAMVKLPSKNGLAPTVLRWLYCGYDESVNRLVWFSWGNWGFSPAKWQVERRKSSKRTFWTA